jgi:AcrR family transcriptional regulator
MPPDATDTKRRILAAAREEFSSYGLAGARVDRIAEKAGANKRSIYVHFGPKETLFEMVIEQTLAELEANVPFDAGDLPSYAARMFDYLIVNQHIGRIQIWAQLENAPTTAAETASYGRKVAALTAAGDRDAVDTLALTIAAVGSWLLASPALRAQAAEPEFSEARLAHFRGDLLAAVAGMQSARAALPR